MLASRSPARRTQAPRATVVAHLPAALAAPRPKHRRTFRDLVFACERRSRNRAPSSSLPTEPLQDQARVPLRAVRRRPCARWLVRERRCGCEREWLATCARACASRAAPRGRRTRGDLCMRRDDMVGGGERFRFGGDNAGRLGNRRVSGGPDVPRRRIEPRLDLRHGHAGHQHRERRPPRCPSRHRKGSSDCATTTSVTSGVRCARKTTRELLGAQQFGGTPFCTLFDSALRKTARQRRECCGPAFRKAIGVPAIARHAPARTVDWKTQDVAVLLFARNIAAKFRPAFIDEIGSNANRRGTRRFVAEARCLAAAIAILT